MLHDLIAMWFSWVHDWGYAGIVVLMAMESSIFPVPSEIVIPPAAYWAAQGKMTLWGVILAGTVGSWLGAAITYAVSRSVGRAVIARWGRWFFISPDKLDRAERFMHRYEAGGIFFARLLPVVRHLISIPAGLVRMDFTTFSVMTLAGSALWCGALAWFGQKVGRENPDALKDPMTMIAAVKDQAHWLLIAIVGLAVLYVIVMRLTARRSNTAPAQSVTTDPTVTAAESHP
jgi:membrane protein DedA with SNARE-associated domain